MIKVASSKSEMAALLIMQAFVHFKMKESNWLGGGISLTLTFQEIALQLITVAHFLLVLCKDVCTGQRKKRCWLFSTPMLWGLFLASLKWQWIWLCLRVREVHLFSSVRKGWKQMLYIRIMQPCCQSCWAVGKASCPSCQEKGNSHFYPVRFKQFSQ